MARPKITLYVDTVSPFAYQAYYILRVWLLSCPPAGWNLGCQDKGKADRVDRMTPSSRTSTSPTSPSS